MNPETDCCETLPEDHIVCLIEYLRKPGARLTVSGETWSMCLGVGDPLNLDIADRLASTIPHIVT